MYDPETIPPRVDVLIGQDLVAHDVEITLDLGLLKNANAWCDQCKAPRVGSSGTYGFIVAPEPVQVRALEDEVS